MPHPTKGFTLIELMIVVSIIGILAAIGVPLYQGYLIKAQLNRALGEVAAYRTAYEASLDRPSTINNQTLGYVPSPITSGSSVIEIAKVNADGSGHLQVTMGGSSHPNLIGVIIRYERTAAGAWHCIIDKTAASYWPATFKPGNCVVI